MKVESGFPAAGGTSEGKNEVSSEQKIAELKKRREGITAFNDITSGDREILDKIDTEIGEVEGQQERNIQEKKKELFAIIDIMEGAYSPTHDKTIPPKEIKENIEGVLADRLPLNAIPRAAVLGREQNLRQAVEGMMTN